MLSRIAKAKDRLLSSIRERVGEMLAILGGLALIAALAIFVFRSYLWLKYGSWVPITLGDVFAMSKNPILEVDWVGIQKAIDWIVACEVEWVLFFAAMAVGIVGLRMEER